MRKTRVLPLLLQLISLLALLASAYLAAFDDDADTMVSGLLIASLALIAVVAFLHWKGRYRR